MSALASGAHSEVSTLSENVKRYKEESAQEVMEVGRKQHGLPHVLIFDLQDASIMHHHNLEHPSEASTLDSENIRGLIETTNISVEGKAADDLPSQMAKASLDEKNK